MAYVNNEQFLRALLESHELGMLTNECRYIFQDIVRQRVYHLLKYNKDKHQEAMENFCMQKLEKIWQSSFQFQTDRPFQYFYTIVDNEIKLYFAKCAPADENGNPLFREVSINEQEERYSDSD